MNWSSTLCCTTVPLPATTRPSSHNCLLLAFSNDLKFYLLCISTHGLCPHYDVEEVDFCFCCSMFLFGLLVNRTPPTSCFHSQRLTTLQTPFLGQQGEKSKEREGSLTRGIYFLPFQKSVTFNICHLRLEQLFHLGHPRLLLCHARLTTQYDNCMYGH